MAQGAESLVSSGLGFPEGLAVDWVSRNVYITGGHRDTNLYQNMCTAG